MQWCAYQRTFILFTNGKWTEIEKLVQGVGNQWMASTAILYQTTLHRFRGAKSWHLVHGIWQFSLNKSATLCSIILLQNCSVITLNQGWATAAFSRKTCLLSILNGIKSKFHRRWNNTLHEGYFADARGLYLWELYHSLHILHSIGGALPIMLLKL
jgi:hypothetical protein